MLVQAKLAIFTARFAAKLIKLFRLGNASSLPGRLALILYPDLLKRYADLFSQVKSSFKVMVTGTNGKTTSLGLLDSIYDVYASKDSLVSNKLGANLYYGIVTAFVLAANINDTSKQDFILEVDEAALAAVSKDLQPDLIAVTNIFRDQLDRFGEIDITKRFIQEGIDNSLNVDLVLNLDDPKINTLKNSSDAKKYFYSLEIEDSLKERINYQSEDKDLSLTQEEALVNIEEAYLVKAKLKDINYSGTKFDLFYMGKSIEINLKLKGIYNVYNALLAATVFIAYECPLSLIKEGLEKYQGSFGRAQTKIINGKEADIFLIKNPKGCSEVLNLLSLNTSAVNLIIINDNYADGRDVSWLWDADFELLLNEDLEFICSGSRAYDMALRLKYAGISTEKIILEEDIQAAVNKATLLAKETNLNILATYTALLHLERLLDLTGDFK